MSTPQLTPRVVIGIPTFRGAQHLGDALTSILAQPADDVVFILVDDDSDDGTFDVARRHAGGDSRLHLHANKRRLGMVGNWNRVLELAHQVAPEARYFAWASDHDLWDEGWLAPLVAALDDDPETVLAYPHVERFDDAGSRPGSGWSFDTQTEADPARRFLHAARKMVAGDMVYGVFRLAALDAVSGFPACVYPDRLLLAQLSLVGRFRQLPMTTWHRRMGIPSTPSRQRSTLFAGSVPTASRWLPWWLVHAGLLAPTAGLVLSARYAAAGALVAARSVPTRLMARVHGRR